jgi:hypothetical protein
VAEWNAPADPYRGRRWLRVLVPTDLRTRRDAELGAANILGYAFLDRRAHACGDASALLTSVSQEMRGVRLARVGHWILDGLAALDRIPGLLRLFLRPRVTLATVVFSNIGRVGVRVPGTQRDGPDEVAARCPVPLRVVGAGPLRPGTRAFFFLSRVRGTLTLTLRTDPRYLDGDASRALLAAYVGKVNDMTGPGALP